MIAEYSLIPPTFKDRDPRTLVYHFPSMPSIKVAKMYQEYTFYKQLQVAEEMAQNMGYILIPYKCIHQKRREKFSYNRKIKIGRNSYFMIALNEMTRIEKQKFKEYIQELHDYS